MSLLLEELETSSISKSSEEGLDSLEELKLDEALPVK
jgi:hypothetical protein